MEWRIFFTRHLKFGQRLKRLHHSNAILFVLLAVTGFFLFSEAFRAAFPTARVLVRESHVAIGFLSCLPLVYYFPKMSRHLSTLTRRVNHRKNLNMVLSLLFVLIASGFILVFHRYFPPAISSFALFVHDIATIIGVPYVTYHSVTRSRWFKRLTTPKGTAGAELEKPHLINDEDPIYRRRTFLKVAMGTVIGVVFAPFFLRWLNVIGGSTSGSPARTSLNQNAFNPLPDPNVRSLPPIGGGRQGQFRYYTVTEMPKLNDQTFTFTINGLVNKPITYNWDEFIKLKRTVQVSDFHCVTGWNVNKITWEGVPLHQFLIDAGVKPQATVVKFYSADGVYTDTLSLEEAKMADVMVALLIDGELITQRNGGPVRLIVPRMFGYKSVKWLSRIELINHEHVGYWEERGYPADAWVKRSF